MSTDLVPADASVEPVKALTKAQAQKLTDKIRQGLTSVPQLLREAYEGQAHKALGYDTWRAYLAAEFDNMNEANAWRSIQKARTDNVLTEIAGAPVEVPARQVAAIGLKRLDEVIEKARTAAEAAPKAQRVKVVTEVIATEAGTTHEPLRANKVVGKATTEVHQPRVMIPTWLQPIWPQVVKAAALEGAHPTEWAVKAISTVLNTIELPADPEPDAKPRRGRQRASATAPQEGDRDAAPTAVQADGPAPTPGPQAQDPFGG